MARKKKDPHAELDAAILEMAQDARATGLMDDDTYRKITMHQLDKAEAATLKPSRLRAQINELAEAMHESGTLDTATFQKITNPR